MSTRIHPIARLPRIVSVAALAATLALATAAPGAAETVLGDDGALYSTAAGSYGALFAGESTLPAHRAVLALDVVPATGEPVRLLVPGSAGPEVDGAARLLFEPTSGTLYAVWESRRPTGGARLMLAGFAGLGTGGWSQPVEISGDVTALKGTPQLSSANEPYLLPAGGDAPAGTLAVHQRSVLHVVWWEERVTGERIFYSPLVFEDGVYVGWNPVVELSELDPTATSKDPRALPRDLLRSPRLAQGRDVQSILVGFVNPATRRLLVVEVRTLPGEIGFVADEVRSQIIEIGRTERPRPELIGIIQQKVRSQIIEIGHRFNPRVVQEMAGRAAAEVAAIHLAAPELPIEALAGRVRSQIIEIGADLMADPGSALHPIEKTYEVAAEDADGAPEPEALAHLVRLRLVANLPAPPAGPGDSRIYVAEDAQRILVSWTDAAGAVFYTESLPGAVDGSTPEGAPVWTTPRRLRVGSELSTEGIDRILEHRVRRRR